MKKFWEKHDLVKIAGIMVLFVVLLSWVIPQGYWSGSELMVSDITRVGIFDFFTYGLLGIYYFPVVVTFLFLLGGFYQLLGKIKGYQRLTDGVAKTFKGNEILFALLVSFFIAALSAIINDNFVVLAFIPFFITVLSKLKLDKLTGVAITFGSLLIGMLGSVYGQSVAGVNASELSADYNTFLWVKLALFGAAFVIFNLFNVLHIKKVLKNKKADLIEDTFKSEEITKPKTIWPVATILILFVIITIMAYLPWSKALGVDIFEKATTWIKEVEILDSPIFAYIFGSTDAFTSFGSWDLFGIQVVMMVATLFIKLAYKVSWNDYLTAFGEGLKKSDKLVIILLVCYNIAAFSVMFPVIPTVIDWLMNLLDKFNVILGTIGGFITSLFSVEYRYTVQLVGKYFITNYSEFAKQSALMLQSTYGLASFITPASAFLFIGLSYVGVSYKDWFKYIWKFLVAMFVVIVILMLIIF